MINKNITVKTRVLTTVLALALFLSMMPSMTLSAYASDDITTFSHNEDYSKTATELVESLMGNQVEVTDVKSEGTVYHINNSQESIGLKSCVTLDTSGKTANSSIDPDLNALITSEGKTYGGDTSTLQFTMQATGSLLNFNYVFASSEFGENPTYNDIFGLFVKVNDEEFKNIALLDNNKHITITNLRAGRDGTQLGNGTSTNIGSAGTEYDYFTVTNTLNINGEDNSGFTKVFNAQKAVNIGDTVTIKLVIADVGDTNMNSYVMIEDGSISFDKDLQYGTVNGEITQDSSYVSGASINLIKGNKKIANVVTSADGSYIFNDVPYGIYTLEVTSENKTVTHFVNVDAPSVTKNIDIPNVNGAQSSIVEVDSDETPDVATDLNGLFSGTLADNAETNKGVTQDDIDTVTAGGSLEIKLTAKKMSEADTNGEAEKIIALANNQAAKHLFIDLSVFKTVVASGVTDKNPIKLVELNGLVDIIIQVPEELRGSGLQVFRVHEDAAEELSSTANSDGEKIQLSHDNAYVTITTKKFSTYSIMNIPKYTVTLNGGATGSSGSGTYVPGETVTLNAGNKSGYSFNGWSSSNGLTFANASDPITTFTMPANSVTVTANWKKVGGSSGGGSSSYNYYTIVAQSTAGGSISPSGNISVREGLDKTFNITANSGYKLTDLIIDGNKVNAKTTYTFEKINKNHSIKAEFKKIEDTSSETQVSFNDVNKKNWYYDSVMNAVEKGWFKGTSENLFSPHLFAQRGMIATVLWRMERAPQSTKASMFEDVPNNSWFHEGVTWANENNEIVKGYGNGFFGPQDTVTREQMIAILYRYANFKGYDISKKTSLNSFTDSNKTSSYAVESMEWAVANGLLSGKSDGSLSPKAKATRAEVATILTRFDELFSKN